MRFVAFVVEATGRLSSDLQLVKLACAESKNNPMLLETFICYSIRVGGAIARYNAMPASLPPPVSQFGYKWWIRMLPILAT